MLIVVITAVPAIVVAAAIFVVTTVAVNYIGSREPFIEPPALLRLQPVLEIKPAPCTGTDLLDFTGTACFRLAEGTPVRQAKRAVAAVEPNTGQWAILVTLSQADALVFADMTGRLAAESSPRNQLAILIDGKIVSAPIVQESITGGVVAISGEFAEKSAIAFAQQLNRD
ncbi:hypothetical protein [Streptosporangium sp. 'caverna']|uniref:SecDF P1 head subdomain-containing protein n=1 Tax=Streptosporangium sp. 'caverna' TaxID=2202249 RepID=UPI000D7D4E06|nr:hypothetical protein [Streptosporangium sp. 'caverna']AWS46167.1 hypothetical protein DKM19_37605 [Streptosporangium sp. 'caverna']